MQRYYGTSQGPVSTLKTVCSGFPFIKNTWSPEQEQGMCHDDVISDEINAHLKNIRDLYKIKKRIFDTPPSMMFISYSIPRLNKTAPDLRLCHILKILLKNNCKIDFLYCTECWNDSRYIKTFEGDIDFTLLPMALKAYVQFIADNKPQYVWITELWRMNYVKFIAELVGEFKASCPFSKIIVDTIDFHYKEFYRKYELTGDMDDLNRANEFMENEKVLYRTADTIVVVSHEEKKDIQNAIPDIRNIETVPNIHEVSSLDRPFNKRKNICFVGNFGTKHNIDAVTYFLENIFHLILERNPEVQFHVLGYSSDKYKHSFESTNVKVIGGLKYLERALTYYRLFVCPMTYGAGMKGKIGMAVAAGTPVVTTSIGAEGFPFRNGEECFIADSPKEFAESCNTCLEDTVIWHNFSVKSRLMIAENFSPEAVAQKLQNIFLNQ